MGVLNLFKSLRAIFAPSGTIDKERLSGTGGDARTPTPASTEPPGKSKDNGSGFINDLRSDLEASVDAAFDAPPDGSMSSGEKNLYDDDAPRELFAGIASNYSQPVKDFIFELKRGTATRDWIEICMPVMGSVIHGAESMDLHSVAERMIEFREALALAEQGPGPGFDRESRQLIVSRYDKLVETLPAAFELGEETRRRESIIIHSLLRQIPEVGHVTLEKLYGAGLTSLETLFLANEQDMSSAAGVPVWLCERICHKVHEHRQQLLAGSPEEARKDYREHLERLVGQLRRHQEEFHRISDVGRETPELGAEKRECLRRRQACALKINVLLAEMGEVDLVEDLRRMGVERRIERLDSYLGSPADPNRHMTDTTRTSSATQ